MALTDWLACAAGGASEPAARAMRAAGDDLLTDVAFAGTAGHVLDFDDTFSPGVAHVSATCAPAALVLAAHRGLSLGCALSAYADGFETMAAVAAASHPALYDAGWHPTAVCGPIGAAAAASRLLGLSGPQREHALAIGVLRAGGTRGAFGSDGKALQVGMAAAAGVQAALLAQAGASVPPRAVRGPVGFTDVLGATWPPSVVDGAGSRAIERNWIKLHPSCLGTHSPIEAATQARQRGCRADGDEIEVRVHPVARQAAHLDLVSDGLEAKFSIPYCVAHTFLRAAPRVRDFERVDGQVLEISRRVIVTVDASLPEFGAVLRAEGQEHTVSAPRGAPACPAGPDDLAAKLDELGGNRLTGLLEDLSTPARAVLEAAGL